jgi:hypothetical protein
MTTWAIRGIGWSTMFSTLHSTNFDCEYSSASAWHHSVGWSPLSVSEVEAQPRIVFNMSLGYEWDVTVRGRDIESVVANYFSMSYSAPRLFGDRRSEYESELRRLLVDSSPSGLFWDWPGDTELVIATKT